MVQLPERKCIEAVLMPQFMRYDIKHTTSYQYEENISSCVMSLCMQPRNHRGQTVSSFLIYTKPVTSFSVEYDAFGNRHHFFDIDHPHDQLDITVSAVIERALRDPPSETFSLPIGSWTELDALKNDWDMWEYLRSTELTTVSDPLYEWLSTVPTADEDDPYTRLQNLTQQMFKTFEYQPGSTHVDSTIDHFLEIRAGVCQDYAHLMIAVARSWGIPARYVSGYLYDREEQTLRAANATHAWVECWLPQLGWMPFDPTNAKVDDENLITVAIGRDYRDVAPSRGVTFGGGRSELTVGVDVKRQWAESNPQQ